MARGRLAVAIPTFERCPALAVNLPLLLEEAAGLGIHLYVSDDSRNDETERLVRGLAATHDHLHYRRNQPSFGHDRNIVETLAWPDADYVWLLGDVFRTELDGLARVLGFLDDQDLVFVNCGSDDLSLRPRVSGPAATDLLKDRLWHQALTGATLYSRQVIEWAGEHYRAYHRNFPQLGIILGFAETRPPVLGWFGAKVLQAEAKTSYWTHRALDVFVGDWAAVVTSHPLVIGRADLTRVIRSHSVNTHLFRATFLHELRAGGHLTFKSLLRPHFWQAMHIRPYKVLLLAILPHVLGRRLLRTLPPT